MMKIVTMTRGAFIRTEASPQLNECEYVGGSRNLRCRGGLENSNQGWFGLQSPYRTGFGYMRIIDEKAPPSMLSSIVHRVH